MQNLFRMPRFYGGHYDSVKQLAYRGNLLEQGITTPQDELSTRYMARLRLDILLGGNVILTDAQFYDGLFFQTLVTTEIERKDFFDFLLKARERLDAPLVEVRRRPGGLLQMFQKPFLFSSLITENAKDEVVIAMKNALDAATNAGHTYSSWMDLMSEVESMIETRSVKRRFQGVIESIRYLNEAPPTIFRQWESERIAAYPDLLRKAKTYVGFAVPRTGNEEIDEVLEKVDREMAKKFPIRGEIEQWIRKCKDSDPSDENRQKVLNFVWNQVLQVYNRALADQHMCVAMDWGEAQISSSEKQEIVEGLSSKTISAIAEISWTGFWDELSRGNLSKPWKEWRDIVCEPGKYKRTNVLRTLVALVHAIQKTYPTSSQTITTLVGGGSSVVKFSADGLSISVDPIKLTVGIVLGIKSSVSGFREGLNLVKHGLDISGFRKGKKDK